MIITAALLQAATGCTAERAALFAQHLSEACEHFGISTPARLAAFLAQVGHESGSLRYVRELASGEAYEGRRDLGNMQPGDGARYRGRGLIQLTGRFNYRDMTQRLGPFGAPDFEAHPEALESPQWACWSAAAYWDSRELNALADAGEFEAITRRINGGLNGQADRLARWARAKAATAADQAQPYQGTTTPQTEAPMPIPAILAALLPSLISAVPKLAEIFKPGSEVAERNVKAVELVFSVAKDALGAANEQEVIQRVQADPSAAAAVSAAVESNWYLITREAGGGGIDGARKADAAFSTGASDMRHSPSFWLAWPLLGLVFMVTGSVLGLWGAAWSDDARSSIAGLLVGGIVGSLTGYYYGQTTTRNRAPAGAQKD